MHRQAHSWHHSHLPSARQHAHFPHHCIQPTQRLNTNICIAAVLPARRGGFLMRVRGLLGSALAAQPLCAACCSTISRHGRLKSRGILCAHALPDAAACTRWRLPASALGNLQRPGCCCHASVI